MRASIAPNGGPIDCSVLLVTKPADVRYLTGFSGSNGSVLIGPSPSDDVFITDARYQARLDELDIANVELNRSLEAVLEGASFGSIGVDVTTTSLAEASRYERAGDGRPLVRTSGAVSSLRARKDAAEIQRLRIACEITTLTLKAVVGEGVRPGCTERELAWSIERAFLERGASGVAFPTIVASGPNGASPHHETSTRGLCRGELVTIDCGAVFDGYHADLTRTIVVGDRESLPSELAEMHAVVQAANAAGRARAVTGEPVAGIDRAAREVIVDAGFGDAFVHPTGHGIGLEIHEDPLVSGRSTGSLSPGTTFTVEPGIYVLGVGGVRIEDSVVAREDSVEVMTDLGRGLLLA